MCFSTTASFGKTDSLFVIRMDPRNLFFHHFLLTQAETVNRACVLKSKCTPLGLQHPSNNFSGLQYVTWSSIHMFSKFHQVDVSALLMPCLSVNEWLFEIWALLSPLLFSLTCRRFFFFFLLPTFQLDCFWMSQYFLVFLCSSMDERKKKGF